MKLLWVKTDFLHPTTRGGQIRSLKILERLHQRHEVHYAAYEDPDQPEGLARCREYCSKAWPVRRRIPPRRSFGFAAQLVRNLVSPLPLAVSRYYSPEMEALLARLIAAERYHSIVCDFLFPAPNLAALDRAVLFQHNVEATIWQRHVEQATDPLRKMYFRLQAGRMFRCERDVSRAASHVIAVSALDAERMRRDYGVTRVSEIPTGVDVEYFTRPAPRQPQVDLVFVGSMDWMPNIDGIEWFLREVLPLIRARRPDCSVAIVGRKPTPGLVAAATGDALLRVTGTVPDVRPHLWEAAVSIVPLRIGGGTRLKIFEAMAAGVPVVSTTIGAEGLPVRHPGEIRIADSPAAFAAECLDLLEDHAVRERMADTAFNLVSTRFSWERVAQDFESILEHAGLAVS